jgi:phosphoribulokinase
LTQKHGFARIVQMVLGVTPIPNLNWSLSQSAFRDKSTYQRMLLNPAIFLFLLARPHLGGIF